MRYAITLASLMALFGFSLGCDETQLRNAEEDFNEAVIEESEEVRSATADGIVTEGEVEDVAEARGDTLEAAGELAEQQGEYLESQTD
ncbi:hypothetical protein [Candidatus Laterigemmans baculatus]|uniref:hypothetical protein n=1 Tax=Candidatus Laterigemmans baculatus TaxID=2770505 RepID=UPI0013DC1C3D|nr:hypothetical protein [Candidatus Laterigemmans baculatus]